jgi:antitoxin VapB
MNLQIRDPRAREKAEKLARLEKTTMSEAVINALDFRLKHVDQAKIPPRRPLMEVAREIQQDLRAMAKGPPRPMSKEEIDAMWGQ